MRSPDPGVIPMFSRPLPMHSRRSVLINGARAVTALGALAAVTAACGSPSTPPAPDPLEAQLEAATKDSELAAAAAKAAPPALAPALTVIAGERAKHATALIEEIARAAGTPTPTTSASNTSTTTASGQPAPPPAVADVVSALRTSADSASKLVPTLSGYRAGLVGSIAAACTAAYSVALAPTGGQQ